jgi:heme-degrading monooxygenase HmoA
MYARITTAQARSGEVDEMVSLWRESLLPASRQTQGFKEVLLVGDRSTGKTYSITLWETAADMQRTQNSDAIREVHARFAALLTAAPTTEMLEVLLHEEA